MPTDTVALPPPTITLQSSPLFSDTAMSEYASKVALDQCFGLLSLIADIRKAAGDAEGRLMQSELVELIARQREECEQMRAAEAGKPGAPHVEQEQG